MHPPRRRGAEGAYVELNGRHGTFSVIVEPKRKTALIGAIVLEDLDLLVDSNFLVLLCLPLEIPEHGAAECADRSDRRGLYLLLPDEFAEFGDHLVTGIEHDRIGDRGIGIEQF